MSPTRGLLRGLRAVSLGSAGLGLALTAHVSAGGATPGLAALLFLAGLVALAAVLLTALRLSPLRLGISLAVMQVLLHGAFMSLGAPAGCLMTGMGAPPVVARGHHQPILSCAAGMAQGHTSVFFSSTMVGAHIVATVVMAALLAYGERALWFLAGCLLPPRMLRAAPSDLPALPTISHGTRRVFPVRFASGGVGRRGPPSLRLIAID